MINDKFEELLCEYMKSIGGMTKVETTNYTINCFRHGGKKQFANLITKEVIFEVWIEGLPNKYYLHGERPCDPVLYWKEYWK